MGAGDPPDEGETEPLVDTRIDFPESDRIVAVTVRRVPESEAYPDGVKYAMHYGTKAGETILRYDNAHPEEKGHERHTPDGTTEIDFPGWEALLARFRTEVMEHERDTEPTE
jgi:hypothetical protein